VNRPYRLRLVLIGTAAAALLAGCGRQGPLDPPPGGWELDPRTVQTPVTRRGAPPSQAAQPDFDEEGRPIAPQGPNRRIPPDFLLD
jgi:hypothetical protein